VDDVEFGLILRLSCLSVLRLLADMGWADKRARSVIHPIRMPMQKP